MNLDLKNKEWKEFSVLSLFKIERGKRLVIPKRIKGNIPLVTAGFQNAGVAELIKNEEQKSYFNAVTIDMFGNSFYREYEFKCDDNIHVLKNKALNRFNGNFIANCFNQTTQNTFSYGKQFRLKTLEKLKILFPTNEKGEPDFEFMEAFMKQKEQEKFQEYNDYISQRIKTLKDFKSVESIEEKKWAEFFLKDIFKEIQRGKRLKKADHQKGKMPYVSSTGSNNGVDGYVGNKEKVRIFSNCLTIANSGSVGACFYQPFKFVASDHVTKLKNDNFNEYTYKFISSLVKRLGIKYSFNREMNDARIKREKILLPVNEKKEPDYDYMENYMKQLEYKKLNEYLKIKKGIH